MIVVSSSFCYLHSLRTREGAFLIQNFAVVEARSKWNSDDIIH